MTCVAGRSSTASWTHRQATWLRREHGQHQPGEQAEGEAGERELDGEGDRQEQFHILTRLVCGGRLLDDMGGERAAADLQSVLDLCLGAAPHGIFVLDRDHAVVVVFIEGVD